MNDNSYQQEEEGEQLCYDCRVRFATGSSSLCDSCDAERNQFADHHYQLAKEREGQGDRQAWDISHVNKNVLPNVPVLPAHTGDGIGIDQEYIRRARSYFEGMDCSPGESSIGGQTPSPLPPPRSPPGNKRPSILRSATSTLKRGVPRQLSFVPQPEECAEVCNKRRKLHLQHGLDGGSQGDLEASSETSESGSDTGSSGSPRDQGTYQSMHEQVQDMLLHLHNLGKAWDQQHGWKYNFKLME